MTGYELLRMNQQTVTLLSELGIDMADVKYLDMYKEYCFMAEKGHKTTYIAEYLSGEYEINRSTFFRLIKKFKCEIKI